MINLEKQLLTKFGNRRPFKTPEGYFDNLEMRVMSQIKAEETNNNEVKENGEKIHHTFARYLRPLIIAASFIGLIIGGIAIQFFIQRHNNIENTHNTEATSAATTAKAKSANNEYLDDVTEYMMLDKDDVYSYLADN